MYRQQPSFPTRRSSDLTMMLPAESTARLRSSKPPVELNAFGKGLTVAPLAENFAKIRFSASGATVSPFPKAFSSTGDRKSTRLNSSHGSNSYAVFYLKK